MSLFCRFLPHGFNSHTDHFFVAVVHSRLVFCLLSLIYVEEHHHYSVFVLFLFIRDNQFLFVSCLLCTCCLILCSDLIICAHVLFLLLLLLFFRICGLFLIVRSLFVLCFVFIIISDLCLDSCLHRSSERWSTRTKTNP